MKVFYVDSFLFLNLVLDYLLLLLTAKLTGVPAKRISLFYSALLGAVFAIGMFLYAGGHVETLLLNCMAGWVMVSLSFSSVSAKKRLRLCGVLLIQALGFSGVMSFLQMIGVGKIEVKNGVPYIQIEFWQIVLSAMGAYILFRACFKDQSLKLEKQRVPLQVEIGEKRLSTLVLTDSGNLLREPLSGKPVVLLAPQMIAQLLPDEAALLLEHENWEAADLMPILVEQNIVARLVPFSTMGERKGITLAVKPDNLTVGAGKAKRKSVDYWIGIARNDIDICGGCRGLIGI